MKKDFFEPKVCYFLLNSVLALAASSFDGTIGEYDENATWGE